MKNRHSSREKSFAKFAIPVVIGSLLLGAGIYDASEGPYPALSRATEREYEKFSGENIHVRCESKTFFAGMVMPGSHTIHLEKQLCEIVATPTQPDELTNIKILGFLTIAHENQHVAGNFNEETATCYALQSVGVNLEKMGFDASSLRPAHGSILAAVATLPDNYFSDRCREGGELDLRLSGGELLIPPR